MSEERERQERIAGVEAETGPELIGRYTDSDRKARPELWRIAIDELNTLNAAPALVWQEVGPNPLNNRPDAQSTQGFPPVGGQVTDIAIDPSGPPGAADTKIYAATNNGGVWKSSDGGATWVPISDGMPSLSIGAVAIEPTIDPANPSVLYAGSGNLFDGQGGFIKASGLYKSVDEGRTWFVADGGVFATTFMATGINRIVCTAADALLVGTAKGLFRSIDGARNFGANAPNFDDGKPVMNGFVSALAMDTAAANQAWVAIRGLDEYRNPFPVLKRSESNQPGGGLFQLTLNADGSVKHSDNLLNNPFGLAGVRFGSIVFAQSTQFPAGAPNSDILYAAVQNSPLPWDAKPVFVGLFLSTDAGAHWAELPNLKAALKTKHTETSDEDDQSSYDFTLGVDPQNADRVYAGFKRVWASQNGTKGAGAVFAACSETQVHWDQHELVFSPHWGAGGSLPTAIYVGSDGGVGRSIDGGANWDQLNAGTGTHLFLGIDIGRGAANNEVTFGGTQDNGTPGHRAADPTVTTWVAGIDGDGGVVAVDPANPAIVYGFDNEFLIKTSDGGNTWALSDARAGVGITNVTGTNVSPIQVTAAGHLFQNNDKVTIKGVNGNTAADTAKDTSHTVVVVDADNFQLVGTTGNGAYAGGGFAAGVRIGRGLENLKPAIRRVALVPNGNQPATIVYVAENKDLRRSIDAGANFAPAVVKSFDDSVLALVCPEANRVWVGTGDGEVHFSDDAGASWTDFSPGGSGPVTGIAVDPDHVTRVAVVYAGFAGINREFRTQHCFLSTNEGKDWTDVSGTDGSALGNLPDLPLHSVVFDSSTDPATIVVGSDAAVLRSVNNGASWERLGVGLPRVTCRSLAIDNTNKARSPRLLRLGTYGRSCYELTRLTGPRLIVQTNFAFGAVPQGKAPILYGRLFNVGDAPVTFTSFARTAGDAEFDFDVAPDLTPLDPGGIRAFMVHFAAAGNGVRTAMFTLQTNDAADPMIQIPASGITFISGQPRLAVKANFQFGEVERGQSRSIPFNVANTGLFDLTITQFALSNNGEFTLVAPAPPLTLAAGEERHFDLAYAPNSWGGSSNTELQIASNDPRQPSLKIPATGSAPSNVALIIAVVILGAAVIVGGGAAIYELAKKH
jgi:hypothetical protein